MAFTVTITNPDGNTKTLVFEEGIPTAAKPDLNRFGRFLIANCFASSPLQAGIYQFVEDDESTYEYIISHAIQSAGSSSDSDDIQFTVNGDGSYIRIKNDGSITIEDWSLKVSADGGSTEDIPPNKTKKLGIDQKLLETYTIEEILAAYNQEAIFEAQVFGGDPILGKIVEEGGKRFYVRTATFIPGITLSEYIKRGKFNDKTPLEKLLFSIELFEGFNYLHHSNIVHNDISPFNILVNADGKVIVFDFDKSLEIDELIEDTQQLYQAPELQLYTTRLQASHKVNESRESFLKLETKALFGVEFSRISTIPTLSDFPPSRKSFYVLLEEPSTRVPTALYYVNPSDEHQPITELTFLENETIASFVTDLYPTTKHVRSELNDEQLALIKGYTGHSPQKPQDPVIEEYTSESRLDTAEDSLLQLSAQRSAEAPRKLPAHPRMDIYSLGLILNNLFYGVGPKGTGKDDEHRKFEPKDDLGFGPNFLDFLKKVTHLNPAERYQNCEAAILSLLRITLEYSLRNEQDHEKLNAYLEKYVSKITYNKEGLILTKNTFSSSSPSEEYWREPTADELFLLCSYKKDYARRLKRNYGLLNILYQKNDKILIQKIFERHHLKAPIEPKLESEFMLWIDNPLETTDTTLEKTEAFRDFSRRLTKPMLTHSNSIVSSQSSSVTTSVATTNSDSISLLNTREKIKEKLKSKLLELLNHNPPDFSSINAILSVTTISILANEHYQKTWHILNITKILDDDIKRFAIFFTENNAQRPPQDFLDAAKQQIAAGEILNKEQGLKNLLILWPSLFHSCKNELIAIINNQSSNLSTVKNIVEATLSQNINGRDPVERHYELFNAALTRTPDLVENNQILIKKINSFFLKKASFSAMTREFSDFFAKIFPFLPDTVNGIELRENIIGLFRNPQVQHDIRARLNQNDFNNLPGNICLPFAKTNSTIARNVIQKFNGQSANLTEILIAHPDLINDVFAEPSGISGYFQKKLVGTRFGKWLSVTTPYRYQLNGKILIEKIIDEKTYPDEQWISNLFQDQKFITQLTKNVLTQEDGFLLLIKLALKLKNTYFFSSLCANKTFKGALKSRFDTVDLDNLDDMKLFAEIFSAISSHSSFYPKEIALRNTEGRTEYFSRWDIPRTVVSIIRENLAEITATSDLQMQVKNKKEITICLFRLNELRENPLIYVLPTNEKNVIRFIFKEFFAPIHTETAQIVFRYNPSDQKYILEQLFNIAPKLFEEIILAIAREKNISLENFYNLTSFINNNIQKHTPTIQASYLRALLVRGDATVLVGTVNLSLIIEHTTPKELGILLMEVNENVRLQLIKNQLFLDKIHESPSHDNGFWQILLRFLPNDYQKSRIALFDNVITRLQTSPNSPCWELRPGENNSTLQSFIKHLDIDKLVELYLAAGTIHRETLLNFPNYALKLLPDQYQGRNMIRIIQTPEFLNALKVNKQLRDQFLCINIFSIDGQPHYKAEDNDSYIPLSDEHCYAYGFLQGCRLIPQTQQLHLNITAHPQYEQGVQAGSPIILDAQPELSYDLVENGQLNFQPVVSLATGNS